MNVSAYSDTLLTSLLLRREQEPSVATQGQDESAAFHQVLAEVVEETDVVEFSSRQPSVEPTAEPTTSAFFQSHLGALGPGSVRAEGTSQPEEQMPLRVSGISAAVAANPFAGDRSLASNPFQEALLESVSAQGVAGAASSEDFSGIYDARTGQIIHRVGARLDVKG